LTDRQKSQIISTIMIYSKIHVSDTNYKLYMLSQK
jgi:hypothetical protein